mgnify:CR=1 FL=1
MISDDRPFVRLVPALGRRLHRALGHRWNVSNVLEVCQSAILVVSLGEPQARSRMSCMSCMTFFVAFFHAKISLSEIFEDYIHNKKIKDVANLLTSIFSIIIPVIILILLIYKI